MGGVAARFAGDHVFESDQLDFIAEFVFSWADFVWLADFIFVDVVGEADLQLFRCYRNVRLRMTYAQVCHQ